MTAQELIKKYDIVLKTELTEKGFVPTGTLLVRKADVCKRDGEFDAVRAAKPEILAILMAEREAADRARKEREEKIRSIQGLAKIRAAQTDMASWRKEFQASFEGERGGGVGVRPRPNYDLDAMYSKYPRAKAYLEASAYANAEHDVKAAAGKKALEAIINGEDYAQAIAAMKADWSKYAQDHMWD